MFNCPQHPFKKCTYLNKDSQTLQCPQCVMPSSSFVQSDLIDIDEVNYMAQSMVDQQTQMEEIFQQIKSFLEVGQARSYELIDKFYEQVQQKVRDKLSCYYQIDDINNVLQLINQNQVDLPLYISSISEVHGKLEKLVSEPIDVDQLEKQISAQIDQVNHQLWKLIEEQEMFEFKSQVRTQQQQQQLEKSSRATSNLSKSGIQSGERQSLEQLTKRDLKCSFQTEWKLSAVSVMNNLVVVGSYCGRIVSFDSDVWEQQECVEKAHSGMIKTLASKEEWLASGGADKKIRVWKKRYLEDTCCFRLEQVHELFGHHNTVLDLVFGNNHKLVSCSSDNTVRIWNYAKGTHRVTYSGHKGDIFAVAHSDELNVIASGSQDKTVRVWDSLQCRLQVPIFKLLGHTDSVVGVAIIDRKQLISSSLDKTMRVWNLEVGTLARQFSTLNAVYSLTYLSPGLVIGNIQGQNLEIWDHNIRTCVHVLVAFKGKLSGLVVGDRGIFSVSDNCICQYY